MEQYDLLIKNVNIYRGRGILEENLDIGITGNLFKSIRRNIPSNEAKTVIDGKGRLASPSFMDTHMHIDEAFTMDNDNTLSLLAAIDNQNKSTAKYFDWSDEQIMDMILSNSSRVVEMCVKNGTGLLKTNVLFTPAWKTIALEAMMVLRERYRDLIDIRTCVSFPASFAIELEKAAGEGKVDFISGYPYMDEEYWKTIDSIFERADRFNLPVDIHCGESDVPDISCFQYFLNKIEETGMNGRVSCGHLTSLSAQGLSEMEAERAIEKAACLDLNVTSLTSCNLYLSSMNRSGPTRVRQFVQAGVNVAVASDNIRDTFRPYGNCDLLEEALLTAKVHRFGTPAELRQVFDMITYNGAKNALVNHYGIEPGYPANLVILDASTPEEALLFQAEKSVLVRNGKMLKNCNEITYN